MIALLLITIITVSFSWGIVIIHNRTHRRSLEGIYTDLLEELYDLEKNTSNPDELDNARETIMFFIGYPSASDVVKKFSSK